MKILFIYGTRPEIIKIFPVYNKLMQKGFNCMLCSTGQHKEMLNQFYNLFKLKPHYDLNIMRSDQTLSYVGSKILSKIDSILSKENPDLIIVQGDTTSSLMGALAAFHKKIKIAHIEAGLRTNDKYFPYPEEMNRTLISKLSDFHFAPTLKSKNNLIKEGINKKSILITGNTVVDTILWVGEYLRKNKNLQHDIFYQLNTKYGINVNEKYILITGHRREHFGSGFDSIFKSFKRIAKANQELKFVYPVHLNPNVKKPVSNILGKLDNFNLIPPMGYLEFILLMKNSFFIITDSGGIQEEAPSFKKPVIVTRKSTERPEAIDLGIAKLVGSNENDIYSVAQKLIEDRIFYDKMVSISNPFGDGKASDKIFQFISDKMY